MYLRKFGLLSAAFLFSMTANVQSADLLDESGLPAVSAFNGKFGLSSGHLNDDGRYHAEGSISFPLSHGFGFQVDTAAGATDSGFIGGLGGHLFMRDPSSHLFGVFGSYSAIDKVDIARIGAEAHFYLDRVSFEGLVGYEDADITGNKAFAVADLAFYPSDNLRLKAGYHFFQDRSFGVFGLEYQTGMFSDMVQGPVSFFAKLRSFDP